MNFVPHSYLRGTDMLGAGEIVPAALPSEAAARDGAVSFLVSRIGLPYLWGGKDPAVGLDCSGAVTNAYESVGIMSKGSSKRYGSADLAKALRPISASEVKKGDLVFYGPSGVSHVMMIVGDGRVIGATGGGSKTTTTDIARQQGAYVKYMPIDYRKDIISYGAAPIVSVGPVAVPAPLLTPGTFGTSDHNVDEWVPWVLGAGAAGALSLLLVLVFRRRRS